MKDVDIDPDEESPYECFGCGKIVFAESAPSQCPDCAGEMRNRRTPIE
ncbi:rubrerythrin-like domain-containing protein [Haloplanus sp. GCM10025708]